jgi:hypothetical protein
MGRFAHSLWASSAAIALLIVAPTSSAWADQAQLTQAANPSFNITAQPLASALTEFGLQAGLQIAVDSATIQGLRSPGVQGPQTAEQALVDQRRGGDGAGADHRFWGTCHPHPQRNRLQRFGG